MKNSPFNQIVQAIDVHRLIAVRDEAGVRVIEPYLIFESAKGDMLLHGWQRSGAFRRTPPPLWCNLHLDDILGVEALPGRFAKPHEDYNPRGPAFHRVIYQIDPDRARRPQDTTEPNRLPVRRRKGPPARTGGRGRSPVRESRFGRR